MALSCSFSWVILRIVKLFSGQSKYVVVQIWQGVWKMAGKATKAIGVFYSYSHKDEALRNKLETQLQLLERQGYIASWHDYKIVPGQEWANEIDAHLNTADIILLLVSPDYIASDYCYSVEMMQALKRHDAEEARVIPIILRPVDLSETPFSRLY